MGDKSIKKRSFLNRTLIFVISVLAVFGLICMLFCAICPLISPNVFVLTSYFGLAFWPILFFNLLILFVLIYLKAKKALIISLVAIILAIPGFKRSCSVNKQKTEVGNIKIMSYNVKNYSDITDEHRQRNDVKNSIIDIINENNPDLVCLQESGGWNEKNCTEFANKINCKYFAYSKEFGSNVIFSKFPLEDDDFTKEFNDNSSIGLVKYVKSPAGRFYIECVHLRSFMITDDEIQYLHNASSLVEESDTKGKSLIKKLKDGFEGRTGESKSVVENLPENNIPIIICGDFNDTPLSYTYHRMRKAKLEDSFLIAGNGIGKTYCGKLPLLRIDYFWCSKGIVPMTFDRIKIRQSDHYPIIMTFNVSN